MANSYRVKASDGKYYTVSTDEHHDSYTSDTAFKKHLANFFTSLAVEVVSFVLLDGGDGSC